MDIAQLFAQRQLAFGDAGEVEQVVDEARFQRDVAPDHRQTAAHVFRQPLVFAQGVRGHQHRHQRSAQFVRERGEEVVLGARGHFGALLLGAQRGLGGAALDADGDGVGDRREVAEHGFGECMFGKKRDHADEAGIDDERVAGKGDHAFARRPFRVGDIRIVRHVVREVGAAALRDAADLELPHRHPSVRSVEMRVEPGAGAEDEHGLRLIEHPDAREGGVEMAHEQFAGAVQARAQLRLGGEVRRDVGAQSGQAGALRQLLFGRFALRDVADEADEHGLAVERERIDRKLHGKFAAVAPDRRQFQAPPEHRSFARSPGSAPGRGGALRAGAPG